MNYGITIWGILFTGREGEGKMISGKYWLFKSGYNARANDILY